MNKIYIFHIFCILLRIKRSKDYFNFSVRQFVQQLHSYTRATLPTLLLLLHVLPSKLTTLPSMSK